MCKCDATSIRFISVRFCMLLALLLAPMVTNAVERGDIAPEFNLPVLANAPQPSSPPQLNSPPQPNSPPQALHPLLALSDYLGTVVYLEFWQSSCLPCRDSLPLISRLRDEFERSDLEVIAINTDANPRDALNFIAQYPVTFPVVSDPSAQITKVYGLSGLPTAYLLSRDGKVESIRQGFRSDDIDKLHDKIFALTNVGLDKTLASNKIPNDEVISSMSYKRARIE